LRKMYRNFAEYLQDMYYNEIFGSVKKYILTQRNSTVFKTYTVIEASYINLEDVHVRGVTFHGDEGHKINFTAAIEADLVLKGNGRRDYEADPCSQWFSVSFHAQLMEGLRCVSIVSVDIYSKERFHKESSLSQCLVPYLYSEDLDKVAEEFLARYYPDALEDPMPVDVNKLVANMRLVRYYAPLPDAVFGKSYFAAADVDVFSEDLSETHREHIERGTILINPYVYFMRNIGSVNNTIIHECIHQDRHGKFFELQKLLMGNAEISAISCEVTDRSVAPEEDRKKALHWMEWQANALTPHVQMPLKTAKRKFLEILDELYQVYPECGKARRMQQAVDTFAEFYGVSRVAAKLRLFELGFKQAVGTFIFEGGGYAEPYYFGKDTLNKGETFEIKENDVHFLMASKPEFKQLFLDELFVYVDGMVCIRDDQYFETGDTGAFRMTAYARDHVDECCLVFQVKNLRTAKEYDNSFYRECFLCRDVKASEFVEAEFDPDLDHTQSVQERAAECKKIRAQAKSIEGSADVLPASFSKTLEFHIKRKGCDLTELSINSGISEITIRQYLDKGNQHPAKSSAMALCVGLNLHPVYSLDLLRKAGHEIVYQPTEENILYYDLITNHPMETLEMWNEKLSMWGQKPIPRKNG